MKFIRNFLLFISIFSLIVSCSNGDDYLFNEDEISPIQISAFMTTSFNTQDQLVKTQTLAPNDSVIFIANVSPSKSIRMQKYYWTIDGTKFSSEFSFRDAISSPGLHDIVFIVIDYFGDTLSDSLQLWIQSTPVINDSNFIPANNTNGIPPQDGINFVWGINNSESASKFNFKFQLKKEESIIVDTIVNGNTFSYWEKLEPFTKYDWTVSTLEASPSNNKQSVTKTFFTGGSKYESAVMGYLIPNIPNDNKAEDTLSYKITILDSLNNVVVSDSGRESCLKKYHYHISSIKPSEYTIQVQVTSHPEYPTFSNKISLRANEVCNLGETIIYDETKPSIEALSININDTLLFSDTLYFSILDNNLPVFLKNVQVNIDNVSTSNFSLNKDTLKVFINENQKNWNYKLLSIKAKDSGGNTSRKLYTIEPAKSWISVNNDTTIYISNDTASSKSNSITFFIKDENSFGFEPEQFFFRFRTGRVPIFADAKGNRDYTLAYPTNNLTDTLNIIESGVIYTNGAENHKYWIVRKIFSNSPTADSNNSGDENE